MEIVEMRRDITETGTFPDADKDGDNKVEYRLAALPIAVNPRMLHPGDELVLHHEPKQTNRKTSKSRHTTWEDEQRSLNKKRQRAAAVIRPHDDDAPTPWVDFAASGLRAAFAAARGSLGLRFWCRSLRLHSRRRFCARGRRQGAPAMTALS